MYIYIYIHTHTHLKNVDTEKMTDILKNLLPIGFIRLNLPATRQVNNVPVDCNLYFCFISCCCVNV